MLDFLFPGRRRARLLAFQIEQEARRLNRMRPQPPDSGVDSLDRILHSALTLLERTPVAPDDIDAGALNPPATAPVRSDEPGPVAARLITLRDSVLATSAAGDEAVSPALLTGLYRELGKILALESIESIEDSGQVDDNLHLIVGTTLTGDPARHDTIAETVRPGYRFGERLIRPQEVIAYVRE